MSSRDYEGRYVTISSDSKISDSLFFDVLKNEYFLSQLTGEMTIFVLKTHSLFLILRRMIIRISDIGMSVITEACVYLYIIF